MKINFFPMMVTALLLDMQVAAFVNLQSHQYFPSTRSNQWTRNIYEDKIPHAMVLVNSSPINTARTRRKKLHVLQYGRKGEEKISQSTQEVDGTDTDLNKYRSLMGNLYGVAGVAHAVDSFFGPSALITASGAPPFLELPLIGKGLVALWCLAGPLAFVLARVGNAAADIGLILYGVIEVIGAYFLPENSAFVNAIAVQIVVFAAWQYSRVKSDKS
jgi:hypothetical protein